MSGMSENSILAGALPGGAPAADIPRHKEDFLIRQRMRAEAGTIAFVFFLAVFGFSAGRVGMAEATFFPCGVAFLSAALRRNSLNLYLTAPILAGILTVWHQNHSVFGDAAAIPICAIVFWLLLRSNLSDFSRMLLCVFIVMICRISYAAAVHQLYRFEPRMLLLEGVLMCGLYYLFHVFFSFANTKEAFRASGEGGVASLTVVAVLFVCGLCSFGRISFIAEELPETAGLLCTLFMGYELGISAGILSAASASILLYLYGALPIPQLVVFLCAGLTAGFFRGLNRCTTAACFAAVCLIFGMTCTGSMGTLPVLPPVIAAVGFALMPKRGIRVIRHWIRRLTERDGEYGGAAAVMPGDAALERTEEVLRGYSRCFASLASLYDLGKDRRSMISHQFRGMQQVVGRLERDLLNACRRDLSRVCRAKEYPEKYRMEMGASAYARPGTVSGDSYICRRLPDGNDLILLSDGMGKGEAAALESSLAVKTLANLIEAGFDVEIALRTLNSILLLKSEEEIFATIDIGIFSGESGRLRLYKIGAASTFIKRRNRVHAVKMAALPMGIVDGLKIDFVNLKLQPGDQVVMVSDGVTDSGRYRRAKEQDSAGAGSGAAETADNGCAWLCEVISSIQSKDPGTMADLIINRAVENYGLKEKDDLTVISAVVREAAFSCGNPCGKHA